MLTYHDINTLTKSTTACKAQVGQVLGVKEAMVAHVLGKSGTGQCPNVSSKACKAAKELKAELSEGTSNGKRGRDPSSDNESNAEDDQDNSSHKKTKQKLLTKVQKSMSQSTIKVFRGIQVPFSDEQTEQVHQQFLQATISANLPFRWVEDPEVMKLFLMFRATAGEVLPPRGKVSGKLLDDEAARVEKEL